MEIQAFNPFLPEGTYIADGEPHVFGNRVFLFGSHDKEGGESYCLNDYEFFSSDVDDLTVWTSKGINYRASQDPLYGETMKYMYAPDCVQGNDGRYYLYYCMAGWKGKGGYSNPVSVAVSDQPDGQYEYLGIVRNPDGTPYTGHICFDPALINDNGTIRLYAGTYYPWFEKIPVRRFRERALMIMSGRSRQDIRAVKEGIMGCWHVTLADDMMTVSSEPVRIDTQISGKEYRKHMFFEGSSIRRIKGKYYFIYSSVNNHELCYAVSDHPDHGFVYGGVIVSNGDVGFQGRRPKDRLAHTGTNHGSVEEIRGQYYVFYHRLTHNSDYSRQACAERIQIAGNGKIFMSEMTSCGLNEGPLKAEGTYPSYICCNLTNGHMSHASNRKMFTSEPNVSHDAEDRFVTAIRNHTLTGYKYFDFKGNETVRVTYRGRGGVLKVMTDHYEVRDETVLEASGQWTTSEPLSISSCGILPLYFVFEGKGPIDLLQFSFEEKTK